MGQPSATSGLELLGSNLGLKVTPEDTKLFNITNMDPDQTIFFIKHTKNHEVFSIKLSS